MSSAPRERARPTWLPVLALASGALGFVGFGLAFLLAPGLLGLVELAPSTPSARSDVRAVYGGIEMGVGAFLAACAGRPAWRRAGLTAQALTLGGAALGRVASVVADGLPGALALGFAALELLGAVLAVAALRALPGASPR